MDKREFGISTGPGADFISSGGVYGNPRRRGEEGRAAQTFSHRPTLTAFRRQWLSLAQVTGGFKR
ncbi:MAG: hypothetical protein HY232_17640 [Acidobacteria bacterium]|nr:hypothetical protein [Acidobacteriota bacterium]